LITRRGKQLLTDAVKVDLLTTDLALYEAGNGLWKIATLLKTVSLGDAIRVSIALKEAALKNVIQIVTFNKIDFPVALDLAHKERLTFYDASYITTASDNKAILVTDDEKLRKIAGKFTKTENYNSLEKELAKQRSC